MRAPSAARRADAGYASRKHAAMNDRYAFARTLARKAGALALDYFDRREQLATELKGPGDFVSVADREVERLVREELAAAFPGDAFLGEETAANFDGEFDCLWVVDPIDGTHNFLRGIPYWNVAIAYVETSRAAIAAVMDPSQDELFHARRGGGGWSESRSGTRPLRCATTDHLDGAYVAFGHHDRSPEYRYLEIRRRMMDAGVAMRNFGSAALQLAHVAAGRLDGFVELELSIWDAIGGLLLVEEAGGYAAPFRPSRATEKVACLGCAPGIAGALTELTE
jgi:myo-inositol-1(or 4)-monophosphatase